MDVEHRWEGRPVQAWILRAVAILFPVAASLGASFTLTRHLAEPTTPLGVLGWWASVLAASAIIFAAAERVARRLLPIAALLKLSMAFPDRAPSRFSVGRRRVTPRNIREELDALLEAGSHNTAQAATRILTLATALSAHDAATRGHSERVRAFTNLIAVEMKLSQHDRDRLLWASLLHDIGKITIPKPLLNKPAHPSREEWAKIRRHPEEGARLIAPIRWWLAEWALAVEQHHERWDGLGYPRGLAEEEISLGARIVAVADAFETMTAPRPYRRPVAATAARRELAAGSGSQFDPAVVRAFLGLSVGRVRWTVGIISVLAQLPLLSGVGRLAGQAGAVARAAANGFAVVVATIAGSAVAPPSPLLASPVVASSSPSANPVAASRPVAARSPSPSPTPAQATPVAPSPANRPPIARPDAVITDEDAAVRIRPASNDVDPEGDLLVSSLKLLAQGSFGKAALAGSGSIVYAPRPDAYGQDRISYRICDRAGLCDSATISITVRPVNDAPVAADDVVQSSKATSHTVKVTANDHDVDGDLDPGSVAVVKQPSVGVATASPDGTVTFTPPKKDWKGVETFTYQVCDTQGACDTATVTVTVA